MNTLSHISTVLVDIGIAALAIYVLYRAVRWLIRTLDGRWSARPAGADPAATITWDVLAEARAITEDAVRGIDATG